MATIIDLAQETGLSDLAWRSNGNGKMDFALVSDIGEVAEHMESRLRTFLGEWFLDTRAGVDWFGTVLVKAPDLRLIEIEIRQAVLGTQYVIGIQDGTFSMDLDRPARSLRVEFVALTEFGALSAVGSVESESIGAPLFSLLWSTVTGSALAGPIVGA